MNSDLSAPLTGETFDDESSSDPYFVFRSDLQHQLEILDELLADYLRIVHETVRTCIALQSFSESAFPGKVLLTEFFRFFACISVERTLLPTRWSTKIPKSN